VQLLVEVLHDPGGVGGMRGHVRVMGMHGSTHALERCNAEANGRTRSLGAAGSVRKVMRECDVVCWLAGLAGHQGQGQLHTSYVPQKRRARTYTH